MISFSDKELVNKALRSLLFLLYHTFPKVRATAAEKLYTSLLSIEEYGLLVPGGEDDYKLACEMLSETEWNLPTVVLREGTQTKFYSLFGQEVKTQPTKTAVTPSVDQKMIKS